MTNYLFMYFLCIIIFSFLYLTGILITGVTLITEMCENSADTLLHFKKVSFL